MSGVSYTLRYNRPLTVQDVLRTFGRISKDKDVGLLVRMREVG